MMDKCIIDTNVPTKASYPVNERKEDELELIGSCIDFIHEFINNEESKLVLDCDWEIVGEYKNNIKDTDVGKQFLQWLYSYMAKMDVVTDMPKLEKQNGEYIAFPKCEELADFDVADRKFIALSLTHCDNPPIVQAADGKWLGFEEILRDYGVHIEFLDREYVTMKYNQKIRDKRKNYVS